MTNILLIGSGAREHAIAQALSISPEKPKLYAIMGYKNPGITPLCTEFIIAKYSDVLAIESFADKSQPEFCIIGPEAPLAEGVVDILEAKGIMCVGPKKTLARLETSKSFTRNLMVKYKIPGLPKFHVFDSIDGIEEFLDMLLEEEKEFVIKPDGLTGGKGVKVQGDHLKGKEDALEYCREILHHGNVIVEEKMDGEEFSLQCLTDGKTVVLTPAAQDHKRAFEDDKGPNTGGMGSYSCENHLLPFISVEHIREALEITKKVAKALHEETGEYYKGIMYGGFMLTKHGVKLIEYNARFGDPETMNVLPILTTDFVAVCRAIANQKLDEIEVMFEKKATVCKYAVPEGYPDNPKKGETIYVDESAFKIPGLKVYFASVEEGRGGNHKKGYTLLGSRAIAFVGVADTISQAEQICEKAILQVSGPAFHRKDIGTQTLLNKRIKHMEKIKGMEE